MLQSNIIGPEVGQMLVEKTAQLIDGLWARIEREDLSHEHLQTE